MVFRNPLFLGLSPKIDAGGPERVWEEGTALCRGLFPSGPGGGTAGVGGEGMEVAGASGGGEGRGTALATVGAETEQQSSGIPGKSPAQG